MRRDDNEASGQSGHNLKSNLKGAAEALAAAGRALLEVAAALGADKDNDCPQSLSAPVDAPETLVQLINECLVSKSRGNRRRRYLLQLRSSWKLLADVHGEQAPDQISAADLEEWIAGREVSPRTARGYLIDVRTLFAFGVKRGYLSRNAALAVDLPALDDAPPQIHTPEEVRRVLEAARAQDLDVCRLLAVQYFAGLRPSEAAALTDQQFSPDFIEVLAARSKSRQRRVVTVNSTLAAWLKLGGSLPVANLKRRWLAVRKEAGVAWTHDVTRHSFASYHLAAFRSQDQTATELGHRSSALLFRHYRALVSPAQAAAYWALRPAASPAGAADRPAA